MTMRHEVPLPKVGLSRFTSTKPVAAVQAIGTASLLASFPAVHAADVSPPEEASDTRVTWNSTARYSTAFRTRSQNPAFLGNVNADGGDRNFNRGLISTRGRSASPRRERDLTALSRLVEQSRDRLFSVQGLAHYPFRTDMPLRGHFNPLDAFPRVDL